MSKAYVKVEFPEGMSNLFEPAFADAAAFWSNIITAGAPTYTTNRAMNLNRSPCQVNKEYPAGTSFDGLTIFATITEIDGPGQILGGAGPCTFRNEFPLFGIMMFDVADSEGLVEEGQFDEVVRHEMGHVIGIGSLWESEKLVKNPCTVVPCETTPTYVGKNGLEGYADLDGTGDLLVATENGPGTYNAHWSEAFFANELMSGFLDQNTANPVSIMTIKSLKDLGYSVDEDQQEAYEIPPQTRDAVISEHPRLSLNGDILLFDTVDISDFEATFAKDEDSDVLKHEFNGIIALLLLGFAIMAGLILYQGKRQQIEFQRLAASNAEARVVNPMHKQIEP